MKMPTELKQGYERFRLERFRIEADRYKAVAEGQRPRTMIVGCADSRVDPATIFSAAPGELYVVRNVAALIPPCERGGGYHGTSAALEFAVKELKVSNIVVMGHDLCGGIAASLMVAEKRPVGDFIAPWIDQISGIRDELLERGDVVDPSLRQQALERMAIQHSLDNALTFPFIQSAVESGRLTLHGAWFSIGVGELHWLDWDTGVFEHVGD
jgi:carbonic anhydrase